MVDMSNALNQIWKRVFKDYSSRHGLTAVHRPRLVLPHLQRPRSGADYGHPLKRAPKGLPTLSSMERIDWLRELNVDLLNVAIDTVKDPRQELRLDGESEDLFTTASRDHLQYL